MSLRPIESQSSVLRSMETGAMQQQLNQKQALDQEMQTALAHRQAELERMRSNQVDRTAETKIRDGGSSRGDEHHDESHDKSGKEHKEEEKNKQEHPYKGRYIDLSM